MEDYLHNHIEKTAEKIIKPIEKELNDSNLSEDETKKVIKEVMVWLLMFAWGCSKNEYKTK